MCRSDALIGLSSTRTSASPGAKGGVGISASCNTLFGSPVSRKINAFINTSWVFRRLLIPAGCSKTSGTRSGAGDEGEHLRRSDLLHAFAERNLPLCHSLVLFLRGRHALPHLDKPLLTARRAMSREDSCVRKGPILLPRPMARRNCCRTMRQRWSQVSETARLDS